ncbi:MAG: beta-phosphoglucomutase [Wenzhouxiangellaceae bacterium]|nr:beta-phosphoglucomutase [Wenzhouxiangellaceae bacterium]
MTDLQHNPATWSLHQRQFVAAHRDHDGSIFALANGHLGVRGGCEEDGGSGGCFLTPVWQRSPIHYHERFAGFARTTETRIPVADGSVIDLLLDGIRMQPESSAICEFERWLDLRNGLLRRRSVWNAANGGRLELQVTRLVSMQRPELLAIRMRLRSHDLTARLSLVSGIRGDQAAPPQGDDPRIGTGTGHELTWLDQGVDQGRGWSLQKTADEQRAIHCVQHHLFTGPAPEQIGNEFGDRRLYQTLSWSLHPGMEVVVDKLVGWQVFPVSNGPASAAGAHRTSLMERLDAAAEVGMDELIEEQRATMEAFWSSAELGLEGDDQTQLALRFNQFQLFQSASRSADQGTGAKGLTGDGYEGHCFWDSEVFMLPALALSAPERARKALEFRHRTLDGARRHAREMNHQRGALYPWRTISGDECSGYFPSGSAQYHINAAIAWAIRVYIDCTDDRDFLIESGAEILFETARLWMQVGSYSERRKGAFVICGVTGPDEYSALVDNNFYTNLMAAAHLRYAHAIWHWLVDEHPDHAGQLGKALELAEDEPATWLQAATRMYLPWDQALNIPAQCDGFLDKPRWDLDATPNDHFPLLLHYHPLTLYRYQVCKQADVVQALIMQPDAVDRDAKQRSYEYYAAITTHDSTLSAAPFSILAAELDQAECALRGMDETLRVDLDNLHGNTDHGLHLAAAGGSILCLLTGIAGLRLTGSELTLAPRLPARWRGYRIAFAWRKRRLRLDVEPERCRYTLLEGTSVRIRHHDQVLELTPDQPIVAELPADARWSLLPMNHAPIEAVIFDLDGVLTDSAELHYQAWQQLADESGIEFNRWINRRLKGVDRLTSLNILLERSTRSWSEAERLELAARKNAYYRERIAGVTANDLLPGARATLDALRDRGIPIALASASRNAPELLDRLEITEYFQFIADPAAVDRGKPDPAIFLAAAAGLSVAPDHCLAIEDSVAGIQAIKAAGMRALGIGWRRELSGADAVLDGLHQLRFETLLPSLAAHNLTDPQTMRPSRKSP